MNQVHCYSLNRQTTFQELYEYRFPCGLNNALEYLALFLDIKSLMIRSEHNMAYATQSGPFFARKVSIGDVVRHTFNSRYPVPAKNRWLYHLWRLIAFVPLVIQIDRVEQLVPETIVEIFATSNGILMKGPLSETADDGLILASIQLWSKGDSFTYAAIYLGWHGNPPQEDIELLRKMVHRYASNLIRLFNPDAEPTYFNCSITASTDNDQQLQESNSRFGIGTQEGRHRIISPSRFYSGTVAKICQMAAYRQRNINEGKKFKDLPEIRERFGPSANTMRKLPQLIANWSNPHYRWYVDIWLREQTAHTPDEISHILSDVWEQLTDEDWHLVMSVSGTDAFKSIPANGRNPAQSYS